MKVITDDVIEYLSQTKLNENPDLIECLNIHNRLVNKLCTSLIDENIREEQLKKILDELKVNNKMMHKHIKRLKR